MKSNLYEIISRMTLEEKAGLCSGKDFWTTRAIERLGIPSAMVADGPVGLRKQQKSGASFGLGESITAVCFPCSVATASSFDRSLMYNLGETLGKECVAENVAVLLGPAINIKRSPLCGRNFEYISEDPYLTGQLAAYYINGVQSQGVGVSVKHYAVNNQEKCRMSVSAELCERTLREIYLAGFEQAVKLSKPYTIMCSYNKINGVYACENKKLLTDILRTEWGFDGYVMTDWGAVHNRVDGLKAGLELEMPGSNGRNDNRIVQAVRDNSLDEKVLDTAVYRVLSTHARYWQEHTDTACFANENPKLNNMEFNRDQDHKKAREFASQSMVLLKNNGILPLQKQNSESNIAFIGGFAKKPRYQGGGSSHVNSYKVADAFTAMQGKVLYADGYLDDGIQFSAQKLNEAVLLASEAKVAVLFVGLPNSYESESYDRTHIMLPESHKRLIEQVCAVNKNTVVVLHNGSPVEMPWIEKPAAVLEAYLGGEAVGEAVCDILFGEVNPSGKLAETFPICIEDIPCTPYFNKNAITAEHRESIFVGYRYFDTAKKEVLFPFGYGLSYTRFEYSKLNVDVKGFEATVSFDIKNIGEYDGAEVSQIYVSKKDKTVFCAEKELKGFDKVFLKKGEQKTVTINLDKRAFSYYNVQLCDWQADGGVYTILVGASSADIKLSQKITLEGEIAKSPYNAEKLGSYYNCNIQNVSDAEFEELLGRELSADRRDESVPLDIDCCLNDARHTGWGKVIMWVAKKVMAQPSELGYNDILYKMFLEMPFRTIPTMSSEMVDEETVLQIVDMLNGKGAGKCLIKLAKTALAMQKANKKRNGNEA